MKNKIIEYIEENYDKLLKAASYITKDDTAGDLLHIIVEDLITREKYSQKVYNCKNFYNYIVRAMVLNYYTKNSTYTKENKQIIAYDFLLENLQEEKEEKKELFENIIKYVNDTDLYYEERIQKIKDKPHLKDKITNRYKRKNLIDKELFISYFYAEYNTNIEKLDIEEVFKLRQTTLRCVADKLNIHYVTVFKSVRSVINKIKEKYII